MAQRDALAGELAEIARLAVGRVGVCAATVDGSHAFELDADEVFPAASSIKMYVFYTLLALAEGSELHLDERIEYAAPSARPGSGVLYHLDPGLRPTLRDLATLMMMISDNTALQMLVRYLGLERINAEIERLGLGNTRCGDWTEFQTEYADSLRFGQGTPREFVSFLLAMRGDELLSPAMRHLFWDTLRIQKYIEPLRRFLPASPWSREFGFPEPVWVASKGGVLDDCVCESGFVSVHGGGWAISIMIRDLPMEGADPNRAAEDLISRVSLAFYRAWAPLYHEEESA